LIKFCHRQVRPLAGHDDVIQHRYADGAERLHQHGGQLVIGIGRLGRAARVVVGKDDARRPVPQGLFHDVPRMDVGFLDRALADQGGIEHAALAVQTQHVEHLFGPPGHEGDKILGHGLGAGESRSITIDPVMEVAACDLRDQAQERSGLVSHALDAGDVLRIGFQYRR